MYTTYCPVYGKWHNNALAARVDAFDQWCQRHILTAHYSDHVTNAEVHN